MADVADGRLRSDAGAGASLHCAGKRAGARLWLKALHGRDAPALRRAGSPSGYLRIRRGRAVGRRLCDSRVGLAASTPQSRAFGFSQCRALVQRADGPARRQARHGSEAGLTIDVIAGLDPAIHPLRKQCFCLLAQTMDARVKPAHGEQGHPPRRVSSAIRTASPASTVPISQRCTNSQVGRVPRNSATDPAASAIIALTLTLITVWIDPSTSDCVRTLPSPGSMNCGSSARYSIAIFGFRRLVKKPVENNLRGPSALSFFP